MQPGQTYAHYSIVAKLGAGGMGEVFRATDTKLRRDVALKVLPTAFAADPSRMARFEQEARALAALNHTNISGIFGIEQHEDLRFLVMELAEGEDLSDIIGRGPLPLDEAVDIARQICLGLEEAHARGIVHRDLKPANIKVLPDGAVKILDFGLAKAMVDEPGGSELDIANSPTIMSTRTQPGVILGTAAYMSPEQARGKQVDRRSDIWALGATLYEMLCARSPFPGETVSDKLASVLKNEPDWDALPPSTPPAVRRVLRRCLEKNPNDRLHDAADVRIELAHALDEGDGGAAAGTRPGAPRSRLVLGVGVTLALALGALIGFALRGGGGTAESLDRVVSSLAAPAGVTLNVGNLSLALAPGGGQIAFIGDDEEGRSSLYVRRLDSPAARRIEGTEGAITPFWSPDGREVGFHTETSLMRVAVDGGAPRLITEANGRDGAWNRDGTILFGSPDRGPLWRVDADGGQATRLTNTGPGPGTSAMAPQFLPDGRHYIFHLEDLAGDRSGIYLGELDSTEMTRLMAGLWNGAYAEGNLLYVRDGVLVAQPLDVDAKKLTGEPRPIADDLLRLNYPFHVFMAAAPSGNRLAFLRGDEAAGITEVVLVDRSGAELSRPGIRGDLYNPRLSHDGRRLAIDVSTKETNGDIWIFDLARGSSRRLTHDPKDETRPTWSADDSKLFFLRVPDLYRIDVGGASEPQRIYETPNSKAPFDLTPDGRWLMFAELTGDQNDLRVLDLETGEATDWLSTGSSEDGSRFSPDGRWVAYLSDESGRAELYLDRFPERGEKFRVSPDGAAWPIWRNDGKELFYVSTAGDLMAVAVDMQSDRDPVGQPQKLFSPTLRLGYFDVTPDGQTFVLIERIDPDIRSVTLIQNWAATPGVLRHTGGAR
jgi:Tol biopolymer transport system component